MLLDDEGNPEAAFPPVQVACPFADIQRRFAVVRLLHILVDIGRLPALQHLLVMRLQGIGVLGPDQFTVGFSHHALTPWSFAMEYDLTNIDIQHRYAVRA
jgi:hypothetical protein